MLPVLLLVRIRVRLLRSGAPEMRDRRLKLPRRHSIDLRFPRIHVDDDASRSGPGLYRRDAGNRRDFGRHFAHEILGAAACRAGQITHGLIDKRHEGGVNRKIVPAVVQIRRDDDRMSIAGCAVEDGRIARREAGDRLA